MTSKINCRTHVAVLETKELCWSEQLEKSYLKNIFCLWTVLQIFKPDFTANHRHTVGCWRTALQYLPGAWHVWSWLEMSLLSCCKDIHGTHCSSRSAGVFADILYIAIAAHKTSSLMEQEFLRRYMKVGTVWDKVKKRNAAAKYCNQLETLEFFLCLQTETCKTLCNVSPF